MIQNRCLVWLPSYRLNMISVWHIITGSVITDLCKQICHCRNTWPSTRAIMCPLHACTQVYFRCTKWKKNPQKTNKKKPIINALGRLVSYTGSSRDLGSHLNIMSTLMSHKLNSIRATSSTALALQIANRNNVLCMVNGRKYHKDPYTTVLFRFWETPIYM